MNDTSTLISPIDVAVCDPDVLWRVAHMNAIKGVNVREFAAPSDALAEATPGHPMVLVVGPASPPDELAAVRAPDAARPEVRVLVVGHGLTQPPGHPEAADIDTLVPFTAAEEEFAAAVLDLLALGQQTVADTVFPHPHAHAHENETETAAGDLDQGQPPTGTDRPDTVTPTPAPPGDAGGRLPPGVILVTSAKGGEGSSTVALNLAIQIASPTVRVALVDGDPHFGDLALDLGLVPPPRPEPPSASAGGEAAVEPATIGAEQLVTEDESGVLLVQLPAPPADRPLTPADAAEVILEAVAFARERADVVVVDLPVDVLLVNESFHDAASTLLVTTGHTASIKNALLVAQHLDLDPNVGLVVNEINRHSAAGVAEEIAVAVGLPLLAHLPYDHTLVGNASRPDRRLVAGAHSHYTRTIRNLKRKTADRFAARA